MKQNGRNQMVLPAVWLQAAIITFILGFTVLGYLAFRTYHEQPPMPKQVVNESGQVLFTGDDILRGQHVFQKYGLMQHGTVFGHGAYLGPDFTAQYLHKSAEDMAALYAGGGEIKAEHRDRVKRELKQNRYVPDTGTLTFSTGQAQSFKTMTGFYRDWFGPMSKQAHLQRPEIKDPEEIRSLTAYFAWATWVTTSTRPGTAYSYTNNWPPEPLAGNELTPQALIWSVLSLVALLGGAGIILFVFGRYNWLGWHSEDSGEFLKDMQFRPPDKVRLTPSQRATAWYFLVVAGLFLLQGLLGGVNAHYHSEPSGFYGLNLAAWLPYNLSRMWHLQLALFFVSASFLAMGIFLAPMVARTEPRGQAALALLLFGALVFVVLGSLAGEAAGIKDKIKLSGPWFWLGTQGWEYLDLGRMWQLLLIVGMVLWLVILIRGLRPALVGEHPGNMPWLFLYSAISIPLFYAVGIAFWKNDSYAVVDFWRFWVVHLWVEDFLELFTTIMVAYIFVQLHVVRLKVALTIVYLDIILYSVGGVIGTMHHLYFSGVPAVHMALGAFFSAMEVIPLLLLTYEAWRFMQLGAPPGHRSLLGADSSQFPHKWAVMFLIAVGFWNFLGAGVFGFLINLPIVSYYEIGTAFTANHGHAALMGVYGMLAMGFFMFVARYFIPRDNASEKAMKWSFWSLNIGLLWMLLVNLFPLGLLQLNDSVAYGYWHARQIDFFLTPLVRAIEWLRLPGDLLFIVGGILPIVYLAIRMFKLRNRYEGLPPETATEDLTEPKP